MKKLVALMCLIVIALGVNQYGMLLNSAPGDPSTGNFYPFTVEAGPSTIKVNVMFPNISPGDIRLSIRLKDTTDSTVSGFQYFDITTFPGQVNHQISGIATGNYYVEIDDDNWPNYFHMMYVIISVDGVVKNKYVGSFDQDIDALSIKVVWLQSAQTITITNSDQTNYQTATVPDQLASLSSKTSLPSGSNSLALPQGYTLLSFFRASGPYIATFESDPYPCPYDPRQFEDVHGVFMACYVSKVNRHQQFVRQAHNCGTRQYYDGSCKNISQECNTFNPLADECYTCKNQSKKVVSGKCVPKILKKTSSIILPENCTQIDSEGKCLTCKDITNEAVDGVCQKKVCPKGKVLSSITGLCTISCSSTEQLVGSRCFKVPKNCLKLANNPNYPVCARCKTGFHHQVGECVLSQLRSQNP